jgi:exonuclease III
MFQSIVTDTSLKDLVQIKNPDSCVFSRWTIVTTPSNTSITATRLDYILATDNLLPKIEKCDIQNKDILPTDHSPIICSINIRKPHQANITQTNHYPPYQMA